MKHALHWILYIKVTVKDIRPAACCPYVSLYDPSDAGIQAFHGLMKMMDEHLIEKRARLMVAWMDRRG